MRVRVLKEISTSFRAEWDDLLVKDVSASPFSAASWAAAWLTHWAPEAEPYLVAAYHGTALVGLAPLVLHRHGPFRVLRVLGEDPSDYWNVISVPERREEATEAIVAELAGRRRDWDALLLNRLPPETAASARVWSAAGLRVRARPPTPYPELPLPASFDAYLASLPGRRRSNLRRHMRHLDDGAIRLKTIDDPAEVPAAIGRWHELRVSQWDRREKEMLGMHREERFRNLLAAALVDLVPAGKALLWEFRKGDDLVGSYVNFIDDRRYYHYLGGFDTAHSGLGIGKVAIGHGIRYSIEHGLEYYDFGQGAAAHKYWFGAADTWSPFYVCTSNLLRSVAAGLLIEGRRRLRGQKASTGGRP